MNAGQSQSQSQGEGQGQSQSQTQGEPDASPPLRWLRVEHETVYDYDVPVELAHHLACLSPRVTPWQQVRNWRLTIDPLPDCTVELDDKDLDGDGTRNPLSLDPWGNMRLVFSHEHVHERLSVTSVFEAGLAAAPELHLRLSPPWEEVAESLRYHAGAVRSEAVEFTLASHFAPRDAALAAFGREAFTPGRPLAEGAYALMSLINEQFAYKPLSTQVDTRAPEVLTLRSGVCQDFAHVMIGACRSLGLAARYVSGYLLTHPAAGQPRLVGADASHAWVAVWCPELGWLALDPTNDVVAGHDHVTLAWGRDYADVAPLRGVIRGGGKAQPRVAVTVAPIEE
ncbi:MAG: transglutaminase family protein [Burkholderiaceae bacterium]|nr:transglutaminase family protein [Burkholderiaceae bacterium]